jgi:hypothetical protein
MMRVTVLGCGGSAGVPMVGRPGGYWGACDPTNPRNRRRRVSILVEAEDQVHGGQDDGGQRHLLGPPAAGLAAGQHEQVVVVAAHPRGQVIQPEQVRELVGVGLRRLERVQQQQLPLHQGLAAAGEVDEDRIHVLPHQGLFDGQPHRAAMYRGERLGHLTDLVGRPDRDRLHCDTSHTAARPTKLLDDARQAVARDVVGLLAQ